MKELNYGGQAVIEGVMMRGSKNFAVAVRAPDGEIVVHTEPLTAGVYTKAWGKWPIVRGLVMLWDTLGLGMRTLLFSADVAMGDEKVEFKGPVAWGTVAFSLIMAVGLFFVLPSALANLMDKIVISNVAFSLIEGAIRITFFLAYISVIGRWEDIRRVFSYHGAEHKTINAYEAGIDLNPDSIDAYSTRHTRCGTSFLLIVLLTSIVLFAPFRFDQLHWRLLSRIVMIPLIAGISYEFLKFSARHHSSRLVQLLIAPGLALQRLTTREPDKGMIEVALSAFKAVLHAEATETSTVTDYKVPLAEQLAVFVPGPMTALSQSSKGSIMASTSSHIDPSN